MLFYLNFLHIHKYHHHHNSSSVISVFFQDPKIVDSFTNHQTVQIISRSIKFTILSETRSKEIFWSTWVLLWWRGWMPVDVQLELYSTHVTYVSTNNLRNSAIVDYEKDLTPCFLISKTKVCKPSTKNWLCSPCLTVSSSTFASKRFHKK